MVLPGLKFDKEVKKVLDKAYPTETKKQAKKGFDDALSFLVG